MEVDSSFFYKLSAWRRKSETEGLDRFCARIIAPDHGNLDSDRSPESRGNSAFLYRRQPGLCRLDQVPDGHSGFWPHVNSDRLLSGDLGNLSSASFSADFCSHPWAAAFLGFYLNFGGICANYHGFCACVRRKSLNIEKLSDK